MLKLALNVVLTAVLFCFVFPALLPGSVTFVGEFWPTGVLYAGIFTLTAFAVNLVIGLAAMAFTVATLGIGAILLVLARIFLFWLIPAVQLMVFAHYFPEQFQVAGWIPAIIAGLLLMVVNIFTNSVTAKQRSSNG